MNYELNFQKENLIKNVVLIRYLKMEESICHEQEMPEDWARAFEKQNKDNTNYTVKNSVLR